MKGQGGVTRQSGGMRSAMSSFGMDSERTEQQAMQGATQQKAVQQQASNTGTKPNPQQNQSQSQPAPPREVGSFTDELIKRPTSDIVKEIGKFFDLNALLGINREDTPEEKAKKTKLHQRYQQLTKEEQRVAQEKYQKALQKKQEEEKIKQQKQQEEQQAQARTLPSVGKTSKRGTALMGGSQKKQAASRLEDSRKTIGKLAKTG